MRKTQEQRRHDTKKAVLSAAVKVLGETGYSKFSSGRVAVRAGVSRGALEHYYPTKEALLIAVCQYVIDEGVTEAKRLANRDATFADPVERFLLDSEHYFFSSTYRAMIELAIAIDGNAKLTRLYHDVLMRGRAELNKVWLDALMAAGVPAANAELFIDLTHHFFRGLFLVSAWLPYKPNRPALLRATDKLRPSAQEQPDSFVVADGVPTLVTLYACTVALQFRNGVTSSRDFNRCSIMDLSRTRRTPRWYPISASGHA